MRNRFDQQLDLLNMELVKMGALCEDAIDYAIKALFERDKDMIKSTIETDAQIDQKEGDIEDICMKLLLRQQPVAKDLRTISSALKMISDMERIGDQAADIAEIAEMMGDREKNGSSDVAVNLKKMADCIGDMVTGAIDSFVEKNIEKAKRIILADDIVDDCFDDIKDNLIKCISESVSGQCSSCGMDAEVCLDLLMVAKYMERIGDHATNIAEWVVYSITGAYPVEKN